MCKAIEEMLIQERIETKVEDIKNLMEKLKMTAEQAMSVLNVAEADRAAVLKYL